MATEESSAAAAPSRPLASCCSSFFEYETPKVVTIQSVPLGILRVLLQLLVIAFVVVYQLWYARGYQEFAEVDASITTKVKGFSRSVLTPEAKLRIPEKWHYMYERVWDEADYVIPPAENGAFFVMTNVVLTPNQTRSTCPENSVEVKTSRCKNSSDCEQDAGPNLVKGHGTQTGNCVPSAPGKLGGKSNDNSCEIQSWCPVEIDKLPLEDHEGPLIPGVENYTVFIKNSISFTRFGYSYQRKNMREPADKSAICEFRKGDPPERLCPIFRLGDIVALAGGNIQKLAVRGGVIGIDITWNCDLDWSFIRYCLPQYSFRILDDYGWNFRYAFYHEENRRTLVKAYGLKFLLVVDGRGGKFDLKNTVIVLVTGIGLLGLSTMFCDFVLLNYSPERKKVKEKKYETVQTTSKMLEATLRIINTTSAVGLKDRSGSKDKLASTAGTKGERCAVSFDNVAALPEATFPSPRMPDKELYSMRMKEKRKRAGEQGGGETETLIDIKTPVDTIVLLPDDV